MMLRQQMQSARLLMSTNPSLSQLRLVPKGWARGQLSLREFNYKRLQVLQSYNYSTTMLQILTIMNIRYDNNYTRDTQDTNRQD
jgi:hypothetical protein